jgi:phospholipase/carboxylesterase
MDDQKPILVEQKTAPTSPTGSSRTRGQAVLTHRVLQPKTAGPHPTVLMIHGHLGTEDVMWIFRQTIPDDWLIVAPRGIVQEGNGRFSWHPRQQDEWPTLAAFETAVTTLIQFIHSLPNLYNADLNKIYLMGFSQGVATSLAIAIHDPELIKGIASLVGFMPREATVAIETARLTELPVFMAVGTKDERIPLSIARESGKTIRAAGAILEYREYETGHKLNVAGMRDLKQWWGERAKD